MPRTGTATAAKKASPAKMTSAAKAPATTHDPDDDFGFASIDDLIDHVNVLYYGREGGSKTTDAARLANAFSHLPPEQGKVLIINAEGGLKLGPMRKRGVDTSRIKVWPNPKQHERATHANLDRLYRRVKADLMRDPLSWGGVVFDSATEGYQAMLDFAQNKRVEAIKRQGKDVDEDFVDIGDYGTMSKMFRDTLRKFRDLPCHFVVTALERRTVDKDTGKPTYGPDVTPGIQSDLLGYVDFVLMVKAEDEDGPFRALTRTNGRYRAKDRFDVLPKVMVDPFMDRILKYVSGDLTPETDEEQARLPAPKAKKASADDDETNPDEVS